MFKLFQKRKLIRDIDYEFLRAVVDSLPMKYSYLVNQVSKEFIFDKKVNSLGKDGSFTLLLNANLESKYSNKALPSLFIIRDVGVWNKLKNSFEQVELDILEGMLAGFRVNVKYEDLDFEKIDVSKLKEKHFRNDDKEFLKALIGEVSEDVLSQLDVQSTFKIELEEGNFYVLKDLGDGNYLSINDKGEVFGMIHDPYQIEKIFDDKESFFESLHFGRFSILEYYNQKMK